MGHHSLFAEKHFIAHIDSHDRLNGTHQDGEYKIDINNGTQITDYDRVVVLSASIPKSYYAIQDGFNTFQIREPATGDMTIEIPAGTYSVEEFMEVVSNAMTASSLATGRAWVYSMSFTPHTAKFTFTAFTGGGGDPIMKVGENVYEELGFEANSEIEFVSFWPNSIVTSTNVINLAPENNVFIRSNICVGSDNNSDILQDIPASGICPFGQIQFYQSAVQAHSRGLNISTDVFRFTLTNEDELGSGQRILNLNGINWTCTLLLYKSTEIYDSIQDLIKLMVLR